MAVSHHHTLTQADFTGTVTVLNSAGSTVTINGSDLWHPSDANSVHDEFYTLLGNTGGNSTASGAGINWAGSGGVSLFGSSNTIVISGGGGGAVVNQFEPFQIGNNSSFSSLGQSSIYIEHFVLPLNMSIDRVQRLASISVPSFTVSSNHTGSMSNSWGYTETIGIYTRESGASSGSFSLMSSTTWSMGMSNSLAIISGGVTTVSMSQSVKFGFPNSIDTAGGYTSGTISSTGSTSSGASTVSMVNILSNVTGPVIMQAPLGLTLAADEYMLAFLGASGSTSAGTVSTAMSISQLILSGFTSALKTLGQTVTTANARLVFGAGVFSAASAALPATIAKADINNNSNNTLYFNLGLDV